MPSPTLEVGENSSTSTSSAGPGHPGRTVACEQTEEVDPLVCHQPPHVNGEGGAGNPLRNKGTRALAG
eukprot:10668959-Heterocapsa_arctica.AAC.1